MSPARPKPGAAGRPGTTGRGEAGRGTRAAEGSALLLILVALLVLGALVAAGFQLGLGERRAGGRVLALAQAFHAAEEGAYRQLAGWREAGHHRLAVGQAASFEGPAGPGGGRYRGAVRRLGDLLFLVQSEGLSHPGGARQRVGLLVRARPLEIPAAAALTVAGSLTVAGGALVNGEDVPPRQWYCGEPGEARPGVRLPAAAQLDTARCLRHPCVEGAPGVQRDSGLGSTAPLGPGTIAQIRTLADKVLPPGRWTVGPNSSRGTCREEDPSNWGDPDDPGAPCGTYFPVVHVPGDLVLAGGRGQGLLLVDGDLSVGGGFRFQGAAIVMGQLDIAGEGGHFSGGVFAATVVLRQTSMDEQATIGYSSCALSRALVATAAGELLPQRSWISLPEARK